MARTPAYVTTGVDQEDYIVIYLVCQICDDEIYQGDDFIAMTDAHDEHADKVHGEGV